jgi:parvulin-like peptidyl-prolyl isomerase
VLEQQVLERLILSQLQLRAAERNGISVDDATLNAAIETVAQRNNMNLTQLRQTVEKEGVSLPSSATMCAVNYWRRGCGKNWWTARFRSPSRTWTACKAS